MKAVRYEDMVLADADKYVTFDEFLGWMARRHGIEDDVVEFEEEEEVIELHENADHLSKILDKRSGEYGDVHLQDLSSVMAPKATKPGLRRGGACFSHRFVQLAPTRSFGAACPCSCLRCLLLGVRTCRAYFVYTGLLRSICLMAYRNAPVLGGQGKPVVRAAPISMSQHINKATPGRNVDVLRCASAFS
eukprot:SAG22_NODE_4795_length_1161_cov_1.096045_2_plen_189_part_01